MALQFQPLKLSAPDLFGIGLTGSYGRGDKTHLLDLAHKCLDKGKHRVVVDVSELKNLGGGGAAAFAEFQSLLVEADGEAVIVGAQEVVLRFLTGKFKDLPLRHFPDEKSAVEALTSQPDTATEMVEAALEEDPAEAGDEGDLTSFCEEVPEPEPLAEMEEDEDATSLDGIGSEVGAIGFSAEEFEIDEVEPGDSPTVGADAPATQEKRDEAQEVAGTTASGRRRDHSYTSLSDAISALGRWSASGADGEFGKSLENLLFSHGLADSATFLARRDDSYTDGDGQWSIGADCSLVSQLFERLQPLTMLDIQDEDLTDQEVSLLEGFTPDIMLPVLNEGEPGAILLLKRADGEEEYSVVEHFALELLMRVLSGEELGGSQAKAEKVAPAAGAVDEADDEFLEQVAWTRPAAGDETQAEVLLRLALDLPDADDRPHFWRIFARNLWPILPISTLAFLGPDKRRAPIMVGRNDALAGINLGVNRLKVYFQTMERPVATGNLPDFFKDIKSSLLEAGVEWIISLRWEDHYLGTAFFSLDEEFEQDEDEVAEGINELFGETARMLSRFDGSHENADSNLDLVAMLLGQREKRMFGNDEQTRSMVTNLRRLARAMGFPPDQERDLIYGCLLRDVGLIDKDDDLLGPAEQLDPVQWSLYRRHPEEGARLLEKMRMSPTVIEVVRHHHERFSGDGFPAGLEGREIPLCARVVTVVENYVAMVVGTTVREPVAPEDAARIMLDNLGQRYDPDLVQLFLRAVMPDPGREPVRV